MKKCTKREFEGIVDCIGELNNSFSGPTGEKLGQCVIIAGQEMDCLNRFAKILEFEFHIVEEFIDGNGEECIIVELGAANIETAPDLMQMKQLKKK